VQQLIAHWWRNQDSLKQLWKRVGAVNENEVMKRAGVGNDDAAHLAARLCKVARSPAKSSLSQARKALASFKKASVCQRSNSSILPTWAWVIRPARYASLTSASKARRGKLDGVAPMALASSSGTEISMVADIRLLHNNQPAISGPLRRDNLRKTLETGKGAAARAKAEDGTWKGSGRSQGNDCQNVPF
jgi:hypothetical protein